MLVPEDDEDFVISLPLFKVLKKLRFRGLTVKCVLRSDLGERLTGGESHVTRGWQHEWEKDNNEAIEWFG